MKGAVQGVATATAKTPVPKELLYEFVLEALAPNFPKKFGILKNPIKLSFFKDTKYEIDLKMR